MEKCGVSLLSTETPYLLQEAPWNYFLAVSSHLDFSFP